MDKRIIYRRLGVGFVACVLIFGFTSCSRHKEAKVLMKRDHIIVDKLQNAEDYYDMHPVKILTKNWIDFQIEAPTLDIPAIWLATKGLTV